MKKQDLTYSEDYFDYNSDIKNDVALKNAKNTGEHFTYFASMQDLRGSKRAEENLIKIMPCSTWIGI